MKKQVIIGIALVVMTVLTGCAPRQEMGATAVMPVGKAFAEGGEIYFMHTEASDEGVAGLLSEMMDSPVLYVPALAEVPVEALANVYVFTNGIEGMGPLGFAPDVFDHPAGTEGYSPLRQLNLVTWVDPAEAVVLKSVGEVLVALEAGQMTIERPGVVINMPFAVWDGGQR